MTDLEISKALALAIGWTHDQIYHNLSLGVMEVITEDRGDVEIAEVFDYRDWYVIGPIAEKYDCFPGNNMGGWVAGYDCEWADTPQRAIAMAVIKGAKK